MKLFSEDIEFLRELFVKSRVELYYFHEKYLLSPGQLARTVNKFLELKIVEKIDYDILLTDFGKKWILSNRKQLFLNPQKMYWKAIPNEMKKESIEKNIPFRTERKKLDSEIFRF